MTRLERMPAMEAASALATGHYPNHNSECTDCAARLYQCVTGVLWAQSFKTWADVWTIWWNDQHLGWMFTREASCGCQFNAAIPVESMRAHFLPVDTELDPLEALRNTIGQAYLDYIGKHDCSKQLTLFDLP